VAFGLATSPATRPTAHAAGPRPPFVLVHGAWHGAWCWRHVRRALVAAGHEVFTPTLTGMGERHHLSSAAVNLDTHTQDIAAAIEAEELQGLVLVAHSYAGYPATAALGTSGTGAVRVAARVSRLIYLDALLPTPGKSSADGWPPQALAGVKATLGEGFRLGSFPPAAFGVPENHPQHAWLKRRLTDMPIGPLLQTVPAPPVVPAVQALPVPASYIRCTQNTLADSRVAAERAKAIGMPVFDLDAGHDAMVTAPQALTQLLLRITD
jgi:pimeloyl-ACP methyl ester carboxylesterase